MVFSSGRNRPCCPPARLLVVAVLVTLIGACSGRTSELRQGQDGGVALEAGRADAGAVLVPPPGCDGDVHFADSNVEAAVRQALGVPNGPLTYAVLTRLDRLIVTGASSLGGVECLTNLTRLHATQGTIEDLTPHSAG